MFKFFDEKELNYCLKTLDNKPFVSYDRLQLYLEKYPKDFYARVYYAIVLCRIQMYEDAEKEYNYILENTSGGYKTKLQSGFFHNMSVVRTYILSHNMKYEELFNALSNNELILNDDDKKYISYFCRIKLKMLSKENFSNFLTDEDRINYAYRFSQCLDYSEKLFLEHIKRHLSDYNQDADIKNNALFSPDFPVYEIFNEIKKYIPSSKHLSQGFFDNSYFFKYDKCGRVNDNLTDYFKVVCFSDTGNFITMHPLVDCECLPYTDLNYLKKEETPVMVRKLSQVDKFNKRYGLGKKD